MTRHAVMCESVRGTEFLSGSAFACARTVRQDRAILVDGAPVPDSDDPVLLELAEEGAPRHREQPGRHALVAAGLIQCLNQPLSFVGEVFTIPFFAAIVRDRFLPTRTAPTRETSR